VEWERKLREQIDRQALEHAGWKSVKHIAGKAGEGFRWEPLEHFLLEASKIGVRKPHERLHGNAHERVKRKRHERVRWKPSESSRGEATEDVSRKLRELIHWHGRGIGVDIIEANFVAGPRTREKSRVVRESDRGEVPLFGVHV
jgi:hypothetical protein